MVEGALAGIAVGALDGVMGCTVGAGVLMGMLGGGAVLGAERHHARIEGSEGKR